MSMQRIFLTQNQSINHINSFCSAGTSWSAATCESADCAGISELFSCLLISLFVQRLFENLFVNVNALLPRCMKCRHSLAMRILSVGPFVRLSNACIVTKRKKNLSRFLYLAKDYLA